MWAIGLKRKISMKLIRIIGIAVFFLSVTAAPVFAQGAGSDWETLNKEVKDLYRAGKYDRALVVAKKALQLAERNVGPNHPDVATSLNNLAALYKIQGQYSGAEPLYKRSLAIEEKALGPDHPTVARCLENMARLYRATKRVREAEQLEKRVARIRAKQR
jgi:tetratricopeptide (TPR) repeat protein